MSKKETTTAEMPAAASKNLKKVRNLRNPFIASMFLVSLGVAVQFSPGWGLIALGGQMGCFLGVFLFALLVGGGYAFTLESMKEASDE